MLNLPRDNKLAEERETANTSTETKTQHLCIASICSTSYSKM
jgi:hypothetical protein